MTQKKKQDKEKKLEQPSWKDEYYWNRVAQHADEWYAELRCCDFANNILKTLNEQVSTVKTVKYILEKALATIDETIQDIRWRQPVVCKEATDAAFVRDYIRNVYPEYANIRKELNRLLSQDKDGSENVESQSDSA